MAIIEDVKRNKKVVNQFYKDEFDKLNKRSKQCLNDIFNLKSKEREIENIVYILPKKQHPEKSIIKL